MLIKEKKTKQLGMNPGTASNRLRKLILFSFAQKLGFNWCYQCATEIKDISKFTIEHKRPWLDSENPHEVFFDLDNIAFSHASCNYSAARYRKAKPCPSVNAYRMGCRCDGCKTSKSEYRKKRKELKEILNEV
tara:strand:- start:5 stop:403 length:399 start_codon:yes stop_codon:yes gene_type:complete